MTAGELICTSKDCAHASIGRATVLSRALNCLQFCSLSLQPRKLYSHLVAPCFKNAVVGQHGGRSEDHNFHTNHRTDHLIIIIDNFRIALFSGVPKLTALYNILQHFLSFTNLIHIIMTTLEAEPGGARTGKKK